MLAAALLMCASSSCAAAPLQTPRVNDRFGLFVHGAGDVDADGHADLLVGDLTDGPQGSVWVLSGKTGRILHHFRGGTGPDGRELQVFGFDTLGDVTGDGRPDVYLRLRDRAEPEAGYARVHSGADGAPVLAYRSQASVTRGRYVRLGIWCVVDDLDRDGVPDVAVGDPSFADAREGSGRVIVESGRDGTTLLVFAHPPGRHAFGSAVNRSEDLDGDGLGEVRVLSCTAADARAGTWSTTEHSSRDGRALHLRPMEGHAVGDLDGDGRCEFLERVDGREQRVVTRAGRELFRVCDVTVATACALADVNGDGRPDFAVGSGGWTAGAVWLVSGRDGTILSAFEGEFLRDGHLGASLDRCGDVDGDGVEDVIAGGVYTLCCDNGRVRVISGADGSSLHELRAGLLE